MNNKNTTMAVVICLIMLLGALSLEQTTVSSDNGNYQSSNTLGTIFIDGNSTSPDKSWSHYDFFSGNGSATNPYLIVGTVDCNNPFSHYNPINILNTKAYFIIKITYITNAYMNGCEINLDNTTHGQMIGSTIRNQMVNIERSTVIIQNTEFNNLSTLSVFGTNNSLIEGNYFQGPMFVTGSNNNTIADNTFNDSYIGIFMNHSNDNIIKNNTFTNVNYTFQDYSGTNNVFITKIATTSKKTPGLTFELLVLALISIVVIRKKRI